MIASNPAQQKIAEHLVTAVEQLRQDARVVEFWAEALRAFAQPIPEYQPQRDYLLAPNEPRRRTQPSRRNSES